MININDKQMNVRFSYKALKNFTDKTGLGLTELGNISIGHIGILMWCGLKSGAQHNKEKFEHTIDDCENWLDDDMSLMSQVMDALTQDMAKLGEAKAPKKKKVVS